MTNSPLYTHLCSSYRILHKVGLPIGIIIIVISMVVGRNCNILGPNKINRLHQPCLLTRSTRHHISSNSNSWGHSKYCLEVRRFVFLVMAIRASLLIFRRGRAKKKEIRQNERNDEIGSENGLLYQIGGSHESMTEHHHQQRQ